LAGLVVPQNPYDFGGGGYGSGQGGWNNSNNNTYGGGSQYGSGHGFGQGSGSSYGGSYGGPSQPGPSWQKPPAQTQAQPASNIDAMMEDLEKRALKKEIEELRAKLAKHEKGDVEQ
jgi:phage shock protein C